MRDDHFTNTEADAGLYERQRAMDDYDPPDVDEPEDDEEPCLCDTGFTCLARHDALPLEVRDERCFTRVPF